VTGPDRAGESLVCAPNGFRCPLADAAESLRAEHGSVTGSYVADQDEPSRRASLMPSIGRWREVARYALPR
jgi:hypothetical protein